MDIRKQLLTAHSKINSMKIVNYIGGSQSRFDELYHLFIKNEKIISQRAAYSVGHVFDAQSHLLDKHIRTLVLNMTKNNLHDAIIRCTVRILASIDLPEDLQGKAIDNCYKLLRDYQQSVAIRAFSIGAIYQISKNYPELQQELKLTLEDLLSHKSPGLKSKSRNVYRLL